MPKNFDTHSKEHIPILVSEILEGLQVTKGKKYIDATFGFGGHSQAIVRAGGIVLGIERDEETYELALSGLSLTPQERKRLKVVHGSYKALASIAAREGFGTVSGILFDLGYSSWQLDKSGRGFRFDGGEPLDMRFDASMQTLTAAEVINRSSQTKLTDILTSYAEEEQAEQVARAIVQARPLMTNSDLTAVLDSVFGHNTRRRAARVYQAFRIAVNDELSLLKHALPQARELLEPGGHLAVISFHSLEDRIVKRYLKTLDEQAFKVITKRPITAGQKEIQHNSRSKSAKLRIAKRL